VYILSHFFNGYFLSIEIEVERALGHAHIQNGLFKPLIKCLKYIARPLLIRTNLSMAT